MTTAPSFSLKFVSSTNGAPYEPSLLVVVIADIQKSLLRNNALQAKLSNPGITAYEYVGATIRSEIDRLVRNAIRQNVGGRGRTYRGICLAEPQGGTGRSNLS